MNKTGLKYFQTEEKRFDTLWKVVATADSKISAMNSLTKTGLLQYFDYMGCNEANMEEKPSPQMTFEFCHEANLKPEEILIVGDSLTVEIIEEIIVKCKI